MKKIVALTLVLLLTFALSVSVFADTTCNLGNLSKGDSVNGDTLLQNNTGAQVTIQVCNGKALQKSFTLASGNNATLENMADVMADEKLWLISKDNGVYQFNFNKNASTVTGSTLSEGNLAIVTAIAGLAVGLIGGFVLGKKKPAKAK